jgi:membrane-associated protease RseP (regulator of RpoE activity)
MKLAITPLVAAALLALAVPAAQAAEPTRGFTYTISGGPRLGIQITPLTEELRAHFGARKDAGILVARVEPGSAADKAGVKVGDVLTDVAGRPVDDADDVRQALGGHKEGDTVTLAVVRERAPLTLSARVPRSEPPQAWAGPPPAEAFPFPMPGMHDLERRLQALEERVKRLEERPR